METRTLILGVKRNLGAQYECLDLSFSEDFSKIQKNSLLKYLKYFFILFQFLFIFLIV